MSDAIGSEHGRVSGREGQLSDSIRQLLRVPPASERVRLWHVSPAIDFTAYHFSWLWVLVPLLLADSVYPTDYMLLFMFVLAISFAHRHYTLGYVYLDAEIFSRHRNRFIGAPIALLIALLATPWLLKTTIPSGALSIFEFDWPGSDLRLKIGVTAVLVVAGVWNVWHVMTQKYGILRIYTAKSEAGLQHGVPSWVDRFFVLGWLPLAAAYVAPRTAETILVEWRIARKFLTPVLEVLIAVENVAAPLALAIALGSVVTFVVFEWRIDRLRNRPRLSMALGILGLWICFVTLDPIKVYLSFAFSHAVEYMVFVWAYQRRRYAEMRADPPRMARILERPWLAYGAFTLGLAFFYVAFQRWEGYDLWDFPNTRIANLKVGSWVLYWGVYQSLLHFYFDGFLWKTRDPVIRKSF